jgi:ABC-type bacteriocin/lantibiotic exporter with double-glycine peptidase domain
MQEEKLSSEFMIENSGSNLSNGQKQIINFLRILVNEHEIVCLDEATSNMDPISDQLVHDKLFEFCQ